MKTLYSTALLGCHKLRAPVADTVAWCGSETTALNTVQVDRMAQPLGARRVGLERLLTYYAALTLSSVGETSWATTQHPQSPLHVRTPPSPAYVENTWACSVLMESWASVENTQMHARTTESRLISLSITKNTFENLQKRVIQLGALAPCAACTDTNQPVRRVATSIQGVNAALNNSRYAYILKKNVCSTRARVRFLQKFQK